MPLTPLYGPFCSAFKTNKGETFIVTDNGFQDNLQGYFIGYIEDDGNHFYNSHYDCLLYYLYLL